MRIKIAAATAALIMTLSACGTTAISEEGKIIETPDGPVVCVVAAPAGGGAVGIDCNWENVERVP